MTVLHTDGSPSKENYLVEFDGPDDPYHTHNWSTKKRWVMRTPPQVERRTPESHRLKDEHRVCTAVILGYTTLTTSFASSIFSPTRREIAQQFGVSPQVGLLGLSLFVLGFAAGPTFWAPLSELKGRRLPIITSMFGFSIFSLACGVAKDLQTVLISRFFAGFCGACPMAVVGGIFSDLFGNATRGVAITIFSMAVFTGPLLGPLIGGCITESSLGWRWTMYLVSIMGGVAFLLDVIYLQETYPPVLLMHKAARLRLQTKNWAFHTKQEETAITLRQLIQTNLGRPLRLLLGEPIITLLSVYTAFIYGLLYLFLSAYPPVFQTVHAFTPTQSGLALLSLVIGELLAGAAVLALQPAYHRKLKANQGCCVPEWRLPIVILGGAAFALGIFWFGWTGYNPHIHWLVPAAAGVPIGFGLLVIFLQALNYLVDTYLMYAASAIAANTFLRSLCGAGFPLFADSMFTGMGVNWACTLLGAIATVMVPIPVLFYLYGRHIRARSRFAKSLEESAREVGPESPRLVT
ncbi:major facilitator superfamily domain-containing protein [Aspergillus coremiiformis]|uniref:Major facilitator superfamily domain-containing protein n=1 Tax=Aspergillus coremiiformis TaxID=138285 RepID=A0A5N6ZC69_9EURO|nr:major facilitator superfamily domain-containing protein [Aspergillus coremiiformis]